MNIFKEANLVNMFNAIACVFTNHVYRGVLSFRFVRTRTEAVEFICGLNEPLAGAQTAAPGLHKTFAVSPGAIDPV